MGTLVLPPEAVRHYDVIDEANRLKRPGSNIELVRTQELLCRFLPPNPATVADIGGAAGIHAFWLAKRGYDVHLVDAVPKHIEQAHAANLKAKEKLASAAVGDARRLAFRDNFADGALLFGPLYHLTSKTDRIKSLEEARRIVRPGGTVMAVGISRFTSTVNCLTEGAIDDRQFVEILRGDLENGQHRNPTEDPSYFTTTFFHHPDELQSEVEESGLKFERLIAVEGPAPLLKDFEARWGDGKSQETLLEIVRKVEGEPHLLGVSTHVMAIATVAHE